MSFETQTSITEKTPEEITELNRSRQAEEAKAAQQAEHLVYTNPDSNRSRMDKILGKNTTRPVPALDILHEEALREEKEREREKSERRNKKEKSKYKQKNRKEKLSREKGSKWKWTKCFSEKYNLFKKDNGTRTDPYLLNL